MSFPTRSKTYCMKGSHQCSARRKHQNTFCSASLCFRCSSSCSITFSSGAPSAGTASTGRKTPQTKAVFSPGTATAGQGRRPYFPAADATAACASAPAAEPRRSSARRCA